MPLRFVFALHNHQPVGNFDGVFESAYRLSYAPFLELLEEYWEVPFSLHTSGCLMEWLVEHKPEYIDRLRRLVARGQVEILGGGFYEPILTMIPPRDRVGQIRTYSAYLEGLFSTRVRGMWVPERVWEQNLIPDIAAAGIEYTVLDDYHFKQAGLEEDQLFGYYVSEDSGRLLRIFPGSERMRYLIPFRNPEETAAYFGEVAGRNPDAVIVFADDGEKLGSWPETYKHCYQDRWLRRFLDVLRQVRSWMQLCTFSGALDATPPVGKVYLPDSSYREMTEWALPFSKRAAYDRLVRDLEHDPRRDEIKRFLRAGTWRNFKVKYPETDEMYGRMLQVSRRLREAEEAEPNTLTQASQELYRAQCNCAWWHGAFGGLYLPHLRGAVYQHLIAAENSLLEVQGRGDHWLDVEVTDLNLDGADEVCLTNSRLAAYFSPQRGGSLYELDLRTIRHNLLATLSRRPEVYHETILGGSHDGRQRVIFKQAGLEHKLQYDPYLRKSLIDHFYDPRVTLSELAALQEAELGDFVTGRYEHRVRRSGQELRLTLYRSGQAAGAPVRLAKQITLQPGSDALEVYYVLEGLPRSHGAPLHFAIELNFAGMAAGADDRYFYHDGRARAGQLQTLQDLSGADRIGLVDEWLGLDASVGLSRPGGIWAFPIQTVSQSEGGYEMVHQSTAVLPHWLVEPDAQGRWDVRLTLKLDTSRAEARLVSAAR
ncbi:MAG TPA: alpha-amylase/4-alpha-glucanotransferase domain-containing protein [Gemmataceae bacterium]|nr:alpha-amylase/4-alpha-glucanotransferase domain-containing protein [Gemmataceae bacterium]